MKINYKILIISTLVYLSYLIGVDHILAAISPDINNDNIVDISDYNLVSQNFESLYTTFDFNTVVSNFGNIIQSPPSPTPLSSSLPSATPVPQTTPTPQPANKVNVGVLFGGLDSNNHQERNETEGILAFDQWRDRWPYYTIIRSDTPTNITIDMHQDDQRVFDQSMQLASAAGIDYWIFEGMPVNETTIFGLNKFMNSQYKNSMHYTLMVSASRFGEATWKEKYIPILTKYFQDSQYLNVDGQRPLLYIMGFDKLVTSLGSEGARQRMIDVKGEIQSAIGPFPYLAMVDNGSQTSYSNAIYYRFEARTSYLGGAGGATSGQQGSPYATLANANASYWNTFIGPGASYIPTVATGLDPRPKFANSLFHDWNPDSPWFLQGSPEEIANQVLRAVNWVKKNPNNASAKTLFIAHWSSFSEGQWIVPTISGGNARLNEISKVLGGRIMAAPTSPYAENPPPTHPINPVTITNLKNLSKVKVNQPIHIIGEADYATRITMKMGSNKVFFINVKGGDGSRTFELDLPPYPYEGPNDLKITGDVIPLTITLNVVP